MFDDDIDAFFIRDASNFLRNLLLVVVNAFVRAESTRFRQLVLISCGCDNARLEEFGNLDGGDAHARSCAQHQNGLSGADFRESHQHVPRRHKYQRNAGRLYKVESVWNWNHTRKRHSNEFAVATVHGIA